VAFYLGVEGKAHNMPYVVRVVVKLVI